MMDKNDIILSIIVPVFNHEKYIAKALDSVLMQKTKYKFEVLVGDDLSSDKSREILKEYETYYPGFFKMFFREKNMHKEKVNNIKDLLNRGKGKYLIVLEGDDYWTDELKIEKQIEFLEKHPDYLAVAHNCVVVDENSAPTGEVYPESKNEEYTIWHYAGEILPGQTATLMYRNYIREKILDTTFVDTLIMPGDKKKIFSLITNGKIYCIQEPMSAYRHVTSHGSSFSATNKYNYQRVESWYRAQLDYAYKLDKKDAIKCAELQYRLTIRSALFRRRISFRTYVKDLKNIKHRIKSFFFMAKRDLLKYLLKKQIIK